MSLEDIAPELYYFNHSPGRLRVETNKRNRNLNEYLDDMYNTPHITNKNELANMLIHCNTMTNTLFSIDVEVYEHDQRCITEIGISIADPSLFLHDRWRHLKNIHIIIQEYNHLRNGHFVKDNKENYIFGHSVYLPLNEARQLVQALVDFYFDERIQFGMNAVLVGHGVHGDIRWLESIGVEFPYDMDIVDTQKLFVSTHGRNLSSLGNLLKGFDIPHWCLHNGGNDATYTLQLLLRISDPRFRISTQFNSIYSKQWFIEAVNDYDADYHSYNGDGLSMRGLVFVHWQYVMSWLFR